MFSPSSTRWGSDTTEHQQEEHQSTSLCRIITWVRELYSLAPAPSKLKEVYGFSASQDSDEQPLSSYYFPI